VRVGRHIELSDNLISEKLRIENDVTYEVDAFVHVIIIGVILIFSAIQSLS
jgi:hypothetical protein